MSTITLQRNEHIITIDELREAQSDGTDLLLLDIRFIPDGPSLRGEYEAGHIPGARFVELQTDLAGVQSGFSGRRPLPDPADLQERLRDWGVTEDTLVVVTGDKGGLSAGRAWWVLRWAGVPNVKFLDGGLEGWQARDLPLSTEEPAPRERSGFVVQPGRLPQIDADDAAAIGQQGVLLDARGRTQYADGHIPGATSAPTFGNLETDYSFKSEERLREHYDELGALDEPTVGAYCGGGVGAALDVLALATIGKIVPLYVGSWSAWSSDPSRPVEKS